MDERYFKPNGDHNYNFLLCYVDDLLHICFKTKEEIDVLNVIDWLRRGFGPPDRYLGANVDKLKLSHGQVLWFTKCVDYLNSAIGKINNSLVVDKMSLKNYGDGHTT